MHCERLRDATDAGAGAKVSVIVMEEGIAHIFLIGKQTSVLKAKIEKNIPKKKAITN